MAINLNNSQNDTLRKKPMQHPQKHHKRHRNPQQQTHKTRTPLFPPRHRRNSQSFPLKRKFTPFPSHSHDYEEDKLWYLGDEDVRYEIVDTRGGHIPADEGKGVYGTKTWGPDLGEGGLGRCR
jgi:hypothetical protein